MSKQKQEPAANMVTPPGGETSPCYPLDSLRRERASCASFPSLPADTTPEFLWKLTPFPLTKDVGRNQLSTGVFVPSPSFEGQKKNTNQVKIKLTIISSPEPTRFQTFLLTFEGFQLLLLG